VRIVAFSRRPERRFADRVDGRKVRVRRAPDGEPYPKLIVVRQLVDVVQHRQQLGALGVTGARQRLRGRVQELVGERGRAVRSPARAQRRRQAAAARSTSAARRTS
jgi:hypothetical protein